MKCERCGNQLDDTDLFCPKCGKAVFEEYMDDDDIWEEYDREPVKKREKSKETESKKIKEKPKKENIVQKPIEQTTPLQKQTPETKKETKKKEVSSDKRKSPVGLICACVLLVCLLIGILWGMLTVKQMDVKKKQETKVSAQNNQEQENQASAKAEHTKTAETAKTEETQETKEEETETKQEEQEQQTEAKPEEVEQKKQDYFVLVDKDSVDFSQCTKLSVANAEQSSMASSDNYDYSAKSAVDGDITSSWQEGVDGLGEGTGIKLSLDGTHKIRYIVLYLGNWRSDEMWQKNARPAKLSINLGDNQAKDVEFSDEKKAFCLSFDEPVEASFVSLYIEAGYAGSKWNDNCISEVELYE